MTYYSQNFIYTAQLIGMLLICCIGSMQINAWDLVKDKNSIKVYTQATPNSAYHSAKLVTELEASMEEVVKAIGDGSKCNAWIKMCKSVKLVKKTNDEDMVLYTVLDFPFPLKNRESVLQVTTERSSDLKNISIHMNSADELYTKQTYVRMTSTITYTLETQENGNIMFTWSITSDPGGKVKASLYNSKLPKDTYKDVSRLRALLSH